MSQRGTRDEMLVGAADILGARLAEALARVAELEAYITEVDANIVADREQLQVRVAELEAQLKKNNHHLAMLVNGTDEDNPQTHTDAVAQVLETRAVLAKGRAQG